MRCDFKEYTQDGRPWCCKYDQECHFDDNGISPDMDPELNKNYECGDFVERTFE